MADAGPSPGRLEELRRRWEEDRTSRIFLQLAEEYRRHDRLREAVGVLEEGLEHHPGAVSAQVALGRCRLELGEPEEAVQVLEQVVGRDPTQLVATKLLVETYLAMGDVAEAAEKLRLYSALNEKDPEIDELEAQIRARGSLPSAAGPGAAEPPGAERPEQPFPLAGPAPPAPDLAALEPPGRQRGAGGPGPVGGDGPGRGDGGEGEPFPGLGGREAQRRWWAVLREEGIFAAPGPAPGEAAPGEEPGMPAVGVAPPGPLPPEERAAEEASEAATATLGELYLRQGHRQEAERIFRRVLAEEPGNEVARRGLTELEGEAPAVEAEDLLPAAPKAAEVKRRKVLVLQRYLERLRRGADRRVP